MRAAQSLVKNEENPLMDILEKKQKKSKRPITLRSFCYRLDYSFMRSVRLSIARLLGGYW